MLDLIFTRQEGDITDTTYNAPLGMSDHAIINMKYCIEEESNIGKYKKVPLLLDKGMKFA